MSMSEKDVGLLRQRRLQTKYIPFYSKTTVLLTKDFRNPIFIKEIRLEGDLSTTDKTTIQINVTTQDRYGTFCIYPDKECKQLIITPAYNEERTGILTIIYEGRPFKTTYVGSDADLVQIVVRARSVLAGQGQQTVGTPTTRVQLTTTKTRVVEIRANKANTGKIYVGNVTVAAANGYVLEADQPVQLPVSADTVYIDAAVADEGVSWIGWK